MAARWRGLGPLAAANLAFVAANLAHLLDHLRQGTERLTGEVVAGGAVLSVVAVATLALTLRHDRRAPLVAAVVGLWTAVAVAASHLAPHWSAFSDSYPELPVDALSWAIMLAEIVTAAVFGLIGLSELRRRRRADRSTPATPRTAPAR
jgi:hypothetical protein